VKYLIVETQNADEYRLFNLTLDTTHRLSTLGTG